VDTIVTTPGFDPPHSGHKNGFCALAVKDLARRCWRHWSFSGFRFRGFNNSRFEQSEPAVTKWLLAKAGANHPAIYRLKPILADWRQLK
jgi:hypothetical protein